MKQSEFHTKIAAAWKLAEESGVKEVIKIGEALKNISEVSFSNDPLFYGFAVAVVEGRAVFIGDVLYFEGKKYAVLNTFHLPFRECSWNPPKPKTVMVEMLVDDVQAWCTYSKSALEEYFMSSSDPYAKRSMRFYEACDTALSCISLGETK